MRAPSSLGRGAVGLSQGVQVREPSSRVDPLKALDQKAPRGAFVFLGLAAHFCLCGGKMR